MSGGRFTAARSQARNGEKWILTGLNHFNGHKFSPSYDLGQIAHSLCASTYVVWLAVNRQRTNQDHLREAWRPKIEKGATKIHPRTVALKNQMKITLSFCTINFPFTNIIKAPQPPFRNMHFTKSEELQCRKGYLDVNYRLIQHFYI